MVTTTKANGGVVIGGTTVPVASLSATSTAVPTPFVGGGNALQEGTCVLGLVGFAVGGLLML